MPHNRLPAGDVSAAGVVFIRHYMFTMPPFAAVRAANNTFQKSYLPVALFVGGTAGIGQGTAEVFARVTKGNAHIIICGRNRTAAEAIISRFPKPTVPEAIHEFVECDLSLMKNVEKATSDLLARLPKLNYLLISTGYLSMRGTNRTEEDIEKKMAVHYYGRWKFIKDLVPLLQKAKEAGEDAAALSVYAAGHGGSIDLDDLGMKKSYSAASSGVIGPTYNDIMVQSFAEKYPGISFTHTFPGTVRSDMLRAIGWGARIVKPILMTLLYPISISPEECGEYTLWAMLQGNEGGAFRRDSKGDDIGMSKYYGSDEAKEKLWAHTEEEINRALTSSS